jgi:hypothetical protein
VWEFLRKKKKSLTPAEIKTPENKESGKRLSDALTLYLWVI